MQEVGTKMFSAIIIAFISSWITVQLSLRRFRTERWWEKKAEAYEKIIEALHNAKAIFHEHLNAEEDGNRLTENRCKDLEKRANIAKDEILKAMDVGGFLLSAEALAILKRYQKDKIGWPLNISFTEFLNNNFTVTENCLETMIKIAKKDLEVAPQLPHFFRRLCHRPDNVV